MQHLFLKGTVTVLLLLLVTSLAWGTDNGTPSSPTGVPMGPSVPNLINFQGRLTDASGNPVADGSHTVNFTLWTLPSGGANVWTENTSQTTSSGLFTHNLGSVTALSTTVFETYDSLYLQIQADAQIILPRIRLTSTPYTRVSQSLETGLGTGVSIRTYNTTPGGNIDLFDELGNYMAGFEADGNGEGGFLYVYRNPSSLGFMVDGNSGGGGSPVVAITGTNSTFFDMSVSGDASVSLPTDAINATEMSNEPGIARSNFIGVTSIPNSGVTNISSRSITIPGPGYIVAQAYSYGQIGGTSIGNILMGIESTSTTSPSQFVVFGGSDEAQSGFVYRWGTLSTERTYFKNAAGTYTIYLNAFRGYTGGAAEVWYSRFVLTYYPTSYGIVSTLLTQSDAAGYSNPTMVEGLKSPALSNAQTTPLYEVDLRELELKVAKAEAETEKAKRELMEAKLKQQLENRAQKNEPQ